jgi:hypothetical protein
MLFNKDRRLGFLPETDSIKLLIVVLAHWTIVFANLSAFFILTYQGLTPSQNPPWYIGVPLCTFIVLITFSRVIDCPITRYENKVRKRLGKETIGGFVKHYLIKPYARFKRKRKSKKE